MADVARLITRVSQKGFAQAKREMIEYGKAANDAGNKSDRLVKISKSAANGVVAVGAAVGVASGIIATYAVHTAKANREQVTFARQMGITINQAQAMGFAVGSVNLTMEKFADISKDISDRVGEFAAAGTGVFQDYIDVLGLTEKQAQETAERFQFMSGRDVLLEMTKNMEDAGVGASQMTFVLESMSDEASRLIPLLQNNGEELDRLEGRYKDATAAIALTVGQQKGLADLAETSDLMNEQLSVAGQNIAAVFAPAVESAFGWVIQNVPTATNAIVDFFNTFKDAENINSLRSVNSLIDDTKLKIIELEKSTSRSDTSRLKNLREERAELEALIQQRDELIAQQEKEQKLQSVSAGSITNVTSGIRGVVGSNGEIDSSSIDAIRERYASETELAAMAFVERFNLLRDAKEQELITQQEFERRSIQSKEEYENDLSSIEQAKLDAERKRLEDRASLHRENISNIASVWQDGSLNIENIQKAFNSAMSLLDRDQYASKEEFARASFEAMATLTNSGNRKLFLIGKAAAVASAVVETAGAISKANNNPYPLNIALMAASAAAGAIQINTIRQQPAPVAREQEGDLFAGQMTTVAERDKPEIFIPKSAGSVKDLESMMTGGGVVLNLTFLDQSVAGEPSDVSATVSGNNIAIIKKALIGSLRNKNDPYTKQVKVAANG